MEWFLGPFVPFVHAWRWQIRTSVERGPRGRVPRRFARLGCNPPHRGRDSIRAPSPGLYVALRSVPALVYTVMVAAVIVAATCSVSSQYGVKFLIDTLDPGPPGDGRIWLAFGLLVSLIAGDNLSWRVAGWIAARTIVADTGDVRADLFGHLMGHAPRYFADRLPGVLTSRITATSNAL